VTAERSGKVAEELHLGMWATERLLIAHRRTSMLLDQWWQIPRRCRRGHRASPSDCGRFLLSPGAWHAPPRLGTIPLAIPSSADRHGPWFVARRCRRREKGRIDFLRSCRTTLPQSLPGCSCAGQPPSDRGLPPSAAQRALALCPLAPCRPPATSSPGVVCLSSHHRRGPCARPSPALQGRVRTKTVKRSARAVVERYYSKLTLDFDTNKRVTDEVTVVPSKRMRNKIAGFITVRAAPERRGRWAGMGLPPVRLGLERSRSHRDAAAVYGRTHDDRDPGW
jgi:ribosomal protein S17E